MLELFLNHCLKKTDRSYLFHPTEISFKNHYINYHKQGLYHLIYIIVKKKLKTISNLKIIFKHILTIT